MEVLAGGVELIQQTGHLGVSERPVTACTWGALDRVQVLSTWGALDRVQVLSTWGALDQGLDRGLDQGLDRAGGDGTRAYRGKLVVSGLLVVLCG